MLERAKRASSGLGAPFVVVFFLTIEFAFGEHLCHSGRYFELFGSKIGTFLVGV